MEEILIIVIEEYALAKKPVPHGHKYKLRIDKESYVVDHHLIRGEQILALAGKTPVEYLLRQKFAHGEVRDIEPHQEVDLAEHGVERFMTIPKEVREGEPAQPRMHFTPLPDDLEYLNALGLRWEAVTENAASSFIIYGWALPAGYNVQTVDVQIKVTQGYPDVELDMAHFSPALARTDGKHVGGLSSAIYDGRSWQQWSRHRNGAIKWRMGIDNLSTHMALVADWLRAELAK
jgi:hypothetical protein